MCILSQCKNSGITYQCNLSVFGEVGGEISGLEGWRDKHCNFRHLQRQEPQAEVGRPLVSRVTGWVGMFLLVARAVLQEVGRPRTVQPVFSLSVTASSPSLPLQRRHPPSLPVPHWGCVMCSFPCSWETDSPSPYDNMKLCIRFAFLN